MDELYTLENAKRFQWSSITGELHSERVNHLEAYLVGRRILDAGCGGGAYVEYLAQRGLDVTGCDKYDQFLQVARERGRLGRYVQSDVTDLEFPDNTFECSYCFDVLEHVDDERAIQELARVTTKRLILAVPREVELVDRFNLTFLHYQDKTHLRNYTEQSLQELAETVPHSRISIFPELPVGIAELVREAIRFQWPSDSIARSLKGRVYTHVLSKLLARASYPRLYTGLVAVIDL